MVKIILSWKKMSKKLLIVRIKYVSLPRWKPNRWKQQLIYLHIKMKTFRFIGLAIIAIIFSFGFVSCGDDDDDVTDSFSIVGSWEECDSEGIPTTVEQFHYVFYSDGICKWYTTGGPVGDNEYVYTYKFTDGQPTGLLVLSSKGKEDLSGYTTYSNGILKIAWVGGDTILLRRPIK